MFSFFLLFFSPHFDLNNFSFPLYWFENYKFFFLVIAWLLLILTKYKINLFPSLAMQYPNSDQSVPLLHIIWITSFFIIYLHHYIIYSVFVHIYPFLYLPSLLLFQAFFSPGIILLLTDVFPLAVPLVRV